MTPQDYPNPHLGLSLLEPVELIHWYVSRLQVISASINALDRNKLSLCHTAPTAKHSTKPIFA